MSIGDRRRIVMLRLEGVELRHDLAGVSAGDVRAGGGTAGGW
jgi:hypothetical protein